MPSGSPEGEIVVPFFVLLQQKTPTEGNPCCTYRKEVEAAFVKMEDNN
jgi:hypothetical protein